MFEYGKEGINLDKFLNTLKELRTLRKQKKLRIHSSVKRRRSRKKMDKFVEKNWPGGTSLSIRGTSCTYLKPSTIQGINV